MARQLPKKLEELLLKELRHEQEYGDGMSAVLKDMQTSGVPITAKNILARSKKISKEDAELVEAAVVGFEGYKKGLEPYKRKLEPYGATLGSFSIVGSAANYLERPKGDIDIFCSVLNSSMYGVDSHHPFSFEHKGKKRMLDITLSRFEKSDIIEKSKWIMSSLAGPILRFDDSFEEIIKFARSKIDVTELFYLNKREIIKHLEDTLFSYQVRDNKEFRAAINAIYHTLRQVLEQKEYWDKEHARVILSDMETAAGIVRFGVDSKKWEYFLARVLEPLLWGIKFYLDPKDKVGLLLFSETEKKIKKNRP